MTEERRQSQRIGVTMTVDLMLGNESGKIFTAPVKVELKSLSLHGGSVVLPSMQADGIHLFYGCNDRQDCCLMLRFINGSGQSHTIFCKPAWFDKEHDESPTYYKLGFEFPRAEDRDNIKLLNRIARGKSEKTIFQILGDFFTRGRKSD